MIDCSGTVADCICRILNVRAMRSILKASALAIVLLGFASVSPAYGQQCDGEISR